ncbi:glycosyltransferase [Streptomyces sp.]|uniref:glycosyltransferase n=1 Tax=Streptomyces sp. TaxID=1931 RepID=UPI002F42CF41
MKVLHIITGLGIGGAEQQLRLLLRQLPASCEVVTLTNPGPVAEAIRADGIPVTHLGMAGNRDLSVLPRLTAHIRAGRYDIVHTHLYRACVYGRLAARLAGVRTVVATEHSLGATQMEGRPLSRGTRVLYRATEKLGSGTLAVSDTVAQRLDAWGVPGQRIQVAPNGIDPQRFRFSRSARAATRAAFGLPDDAFVVGGMGRFIPSKGFDLLLRAVAADPRAHLLLAGDGPEEFTLLRIIHECGIADRVRLASPGLSPDVPELLAAMDLFVSPSREESFGLAVIEALAAGLPALYVSCPAVEDLPATDAPGAVRIDPDQLEAAVRTRLDAGPHRLPVPPALARYDIARTAENVMAFYTAAVSGRGGRRRTAVPTQSPAASPARTPGRPPGRASGSRPGATPAAAGPMTGPAPRTAEK